MMNDVLDQVLSIFQCDRAWFVYPCDPDTDQWEVPMERTKPEYPGALAIGTTVPMDPGTAGVMRILLGLDGPVQFGPDLEHSVPELVSKEFSVRSMVAMALHPRGDRPWAFGIHQCSEARNWSDSEVRLFEAIGRRLGDALTSMRMYRNLQESEERLRLTLEAAEIVAWELNPVTGKIRDAGPVGKLFGRDENFGFERMEDLADTIHPDDREAVIAKVEEAMRSESDFKIEYRVLLDDGSIRWLAADGNIQPAGEGRPALLLGVGRDITEQKLADAEKEKLQTQLAQAQKMESVGRLAGGVAHDFNNMLSVIIGNAELALMNIPPESRLYPRLKAVDAAARRSADLTRQLLAFARKQTIIPRILNLNDTLSGMREMLRRLIGEDIELTWISGGELWFVRMDPGQVDQVLVNLCVNARDALTGVGTISIETGNRTFDEVYCAGHAGFVPGEYVLLAVSDNGSGMDEETQSHMFEPFFTTKGLGKGTGLGLATVYGIVKQNNGFINVYSEPGHGTTFKLYFPRYKADRAEKAPSIEGEEALRGVETVLVVEDEQAILDICKNILEELGYKPLTARTPGDAIGLFEEHKEEIHLLLTDVVLPEMNGLELSKRLTAIKPGLKCMFMSGYTSDIIAHRGVLDKNVQFIQKPISVKDLAVGVRKALDRE
jgi:PAS domain S-box-containing protein